MAGPFGGPPNFTPTGHQPPDQPQPEVNTLATLSVVFAAVFAPVGAALGHLALRQIRRTGQRGRDRALIGLTVSYVVIVAVVIGLVVWISTRGAGDPTPAPEPNSPVSAPPSPSASASTTPTVTVGPGPADRSFTPAAPLLSLDEMRKLMNEERGFPYFVTPSQITDFAAYPQLDQPEELPGTQGTVSDPTCAPMYFAGTASGFEGLEYREIRSVTMGQPGPNATQSVTQAAIVFDSPEAANAALATYAQRVNACGTRTGLTLTLAGTGKTYEMNNGTVENMGSASTGPAAGVDLYVGRAEPEGYSHAPRTEGQFVVERGFAVKGNTLVDVSLRGLGFMAQQQNILDAMVAKI
ncbi:sensor domain-containing protein [Mycobacterium sp. NPDC049093]